MERERKDLNANEVESLDTLMMLAGIEDDKTALNYLDMAGWNVEQAMNLYLDFGSTNPNNGQQNNTNNNNPYIPPDVDLNAPPEYQPYMNDIQPNNMYGGGVYGMAPPQPQGPMPEFTAEQKQYYTDLQNKNKGIGGMISKGFKSIANN